jgi:DNA-binding LytR/AlgR family response regulator
MNVIIVDDEPLALDILETYIEQIPDLNLIARCENALEAREVLKNQTVDLIFLDIQMPELTGIDFAKTLLNPPMIVFTTAFPNFAVEGFELNAIDYLLKPVSFDRFNKAIQKCMSKLEIKKSKSTIDQEENQQDYIFVKADKKLIKVKYADILYIEGLKDYVIIRTETGRVITLQTMKSLEDKMPEARFMRVHRSYIVNIEKITAINGNMIEVIEKNETKQIPVGKNYRDELSRVVDVNKL